MNNKDFISDLKAQIRFIKRNVISENNDYLTGYVCALSCVEGMIAKFEEKEGYNDE